MLLLQKCVSLAPGSTPPVLHHSGLQITDFVVSFVALYFLGALVFFYIRAVQKIQHYKNWNKWRTISFIAGALLIAIALAPPMMEYAHQDFEGHMVQHLLLAMFGPIGLVLAAPVTLLLSSLPKRAAMKLGRLLNSRFFHFITRPVVALLLNAGGMYALYMTDLYSYLHTVPYLHYLVHFHFLAAGYLFTWVIIGKDPAPHRPKLPTRVIILVLSIALHANLCKIMYAYSYPRNAIHSQSEIQEAAQMMYYGGDFAELLVVIALFATWYTRNGKPYYKFSRRNLLK